MLCLIGFEIYSRCLWSTKNMILAPFQLSSVLIFLTRFTKVRESSNVNPNISRNIVTSPYGSTFSKLPALGSCARTSALHFSGFKFISFHETTSTPPRVPCWDLHEMHEQFFYPIREFFSASKSSFIFSLHDINLTLGLLSPGPSCSKLVKKTQG